MRLRFILLAFVVSLISCHKAEQKPVEAESVYDECTHCKDITCPRWAKSNFSILGTPFLENAIDLQVNLEMLPDSILDVNFDNFNTPRNLYGWEDVEFAGPAKLFGWNGTLSMCISPIIEFDSLQNKSQIIAFRTIHVGFASEEMTSHAFESILDQLQNFYGDFNAFDDGSDRRYYYYKSSMGEVVAKFLPYNTLGRTIVDFVKLK